MKFRNVIKYLQACSFVLSFFFLLFYVLMNVSVGGASLWLSDWSNNALDEVVDRDKKNQRILYYGLILLSQGNSKLSKKLYEVFIWKADFI